MESAWQCSPPGSPPRMRGRPRVAGDVPGGDRLTPAYAGKTSTPCGCRCCRPAHPRVCGEDAQRQPGHAGDLGSPPRMRGRPRQPHHHRSSPGLTPAYAGKTRSGSRDSGTRRAHPRVCGEDRPILHWTATDVGSPPRMRGRPSPTMQFTAPITELDTTQEPVPSISICPLAVHSSSSTPHIQHYLNPIASNPCSHQDRSNQREPVASTFH